MRKMLPLALIALFASSMALAADSGEKHPKWSYVEAGYMDFNPDNGLSDNGWFAGGSAGIAMFHVFAEYDDIGDYTFWNAGFGWHGLFGDPADLYVQAQWNDVQVDTTGGGSIDDDGYEVSAGIRWKILKWLEVKGQANWSDYSDAGDEWSGQAGVLFSLLSDRLGFGADYVLTENDDRIRGYVRWSFGK